ncbi:MAG TPA: tetratricopeptide repeat protein, partial [Dehalococcoidia bacterium]|nr:tetratricopeptide repeat protein [Dehalococcoidia bacterium]
MTLISAPAGYGKTTLLLDFAQSWDHPVCWYSLDERDAELQNFLRYLCASMQGQIPGFGPELAAVLRAGRAVCPEQAIDLLVTATQAVGAPFVMIFDDFHYLDEAPDDVRETVEGWLYRLPENCHVIISGRTQPQLGVLPIMSVRQEVDRITMGDFSFTCDEVVHLFREVLGKELTLDDAQQLADLTEGWAAALVLMADKGKTGRSVTSLEQLRSSDTLFQYMWREQLGPLPDDVKEFLTGSAVLRSIDEETLNLLLGIPDAEEQLAFLERRNLFVIRDESGQNHYRYQRLFRAFLVSYLRAKDPGRFVDLNLKAAALMEAAEFVEEAVYHYIQAAAWDRIVQVTERVGWRLFEEGRWDTLAYWLDAVPAEELAAQPKLILWKARILHYLNQIDSALALLTQAIGSLDKKKEWPALAEALITKGMCLRVKGDFLQSREALTQARALLDDHNGPAATLSEARKELGITLNLCGELSKAVQELTAVLDIYESQGDVYNIAHTSDQLAAALGRAGRLSEAAGYLERARKRWMKLGNHHRLVQTLLNLGIVCLSQGHFREAEAILQQGLKSARAIGEQKWECYLLSNLADVKRELGEYEAALDLYTSVLDQGWSLDDAHVRIYIADGIANTYRLMGDLVNGESWAKRALAEAEKRGGAMEIGLCLATAGLLKRHQGDLKEAASLMEKAVAHLKDADAKRELALASLHLSAVYFSLKRKTMALTALQETADAVSELGYDHFLLVEAARNPLLIQYAAANKLADGYYARVLKLIKTPQPVSKPDIGSEPAEDETTDGVRAYGFGQPRAVVGGHEVSDLEWRSEKSKEMFFFFLCNRRPLRKEEIVTALWPDLPEEKTTSAFHSNMYRLRKALYQ